MEKILATISQFPRVKLIDSLSLARQAGSLLTQNMVLLGAASPYLIIGEIHLKEAINQLFAAKGEGIVAMNIKAFELGREIVGQDD